MNNEKGKHMGDEQQLPDFTEVIDVTTLPNWSDPQFQETFAKVDEFLNDPSIGVTRGLPKRRVPQSTPPATEDADDFIEVDLTTPEGFHKAIEIVEGYVMECFLVTRDPDISKEGKVELFNEVIAYLRPLPNNVLMGVIMQIADSAAGLAVQVMQSQTSPSPHRSTT